MKGYHALTAALLLTACSSAPKPAPTSVELTEDACKAALADLAADKDAGMPCTVAKRQVLAAHPWCQLHFTCPDELDGGAE